MQSSQAVDSVSRLTEIELARRFLLGKRLPFEAANELWARLKKAYQLSLARQVLDRIHQDGALEDELPAASRGKLCQQRALLTSKDPELSVDSKHDLAMRLLRECFDLEAPDAAQETLGIAGGICKRRWESLGSRDDLLRALDYYSRAAQGPLGTDAYPHINAAYLEDVLAHLGDAPAERRERASQWRKKIVDPQFPKKKDCWFNFASRIEAHVGLRSYGQALQDAKEGIPACELWEFQTTVRQLAKLAQLHEKQPLHNAQLRELFELLMPDATGAIPALVAGRFGLALSGGGFRASFFHLGVLARLAELDVLRHVEVLSCVSGGSIVGACYWLALRRRLIDGTLKNGNDYVTLIKELIARFQTAISQDLRRQVQTGVIRKFFARLLRHGSRGLLDPVRVADKLDRWFYRPLMPSDDPVLMRSLPFQPEDHDPELTRSEFNPVQHNWLREHKVPVLVINATTVNTGHCWQFTPTWMGESPWAVNRAADSVPRLAWFYYEDSKAADVELGRAVAASAGVPLIFEPLRLGELYEENYDVSLVDGGVHDNQGTVALLAHDCDILFVSDASGQLLGEPGHRRASPFGHARRLQDVLMERVRWANFGDLKARHRSGQLKGFLFLHMKDGLDAPIIRPKDSQETYSMRHAPLSPSGVRKDFQKALAELRTDLDAFSHNEANALMACGYQMATSGWDRELRSLMPTNPISGTWQFAELLDEITSTKSTTSSRQTLLAELSRGKRVRFLGGEGR